MDSDTIFAQIKSATQRETDIVFGYVRQCEHILNVKTIPPLIATTCLYFYFQRERFDPDCHANDISLSGDNRIIRRVRQGLGMVYLSKIIKTGIHVWRFKLISKESSLWLAIGL